MISKESRKRFVEHLCCDMTRGTLEGIAERAGYKNPRRIDRCKLEHIAYIDHTLGDCTLERYRIWDDTTNQILVNNCSRKFMIDFIMRKCIYNWYEEAEIPILRDSFQHPVRVMSLRR